MLSQGLRIRGATRAIVGFLELGHYSIANRGPTTEPRSEVAQPLYGFPDEVGTPKWIVDAGGECQRESGVAGDFGRKGWDAAAKNGVDRDGIKAVDFHRGASRVVERGAAAMAPGA
jgi:hypothetical protein